jgi:hypothetical protein
MAENVTAQPKVYVVNPTLQHCFAIGHLSNPASNRPPRNASYPIPARLAAPADRLYPPLLAPGSPELACDVHRVLCSLVPASRSLRTYWERDSACTVSRAKAQLPTCLPSNCVAELLPFTTALVVDFGPSPTSTHAPSGLFSRNLTEYVYKPSCSQTRPSFARSSKLAGR